MSFAYKKQLEAMRQATLDRGDTKFKTPTAKESLDNQQGLMRRQTGVIQETSFDAQEKGIGLAIAEAMSENTKTEGGSKRAPPSPLPEKFQYQLDEPGSGFSRVKRKLIARGLPPHIATAFAINFKDESGLKSDAQEASPLVKGSRGGFGIYQTTGKRRVDYEAFADGLGADYSSEDAQLDWLLEEIHGSEKRAWNKIKNTDNVSDAAVAIVNHFLRPAEKHRKARASRYAALGK